MATADGVRSLARGARVPRVLVVDDEANLRELMELTLVGMGLDVDVAADLGEARRLLAQQQYSLCLTDMRLPDGNGLELVRLIAARSPDTPVAVITAYGSAENAVAALKAGAFDYLAKPVGLDSLRALIRSALRLPALGDIEPGGRPTPGKLGRLTEPANCCSAFRRRSRLSAPASPGWRAAWRRLRFPANPGPARNLRRG